MKEQFKNPVGYFFVKELANGKLFAKQTDPNAPFLDINSPKMNELTGYDFIYQFEELEFEEA